MSFASPQSLRTDLRSNYVFLHRSGVRVRRYLRKCDMCTWMPCHLCTIDFQAFDTAQPEVPHYQASTIMTSGPSYLLAARVTHTIRLTPLVHSFQTKLYPGSCP